MRGLRELGALVLLALSARLVGAWLLGEGAPFGPDGTGLEAAVVLGGHRYPAHVAAVGLVLRVAREALAESAWPQRGEQLRRAARHPGSALSLPPGPIYAGRVLFTSESSR